ncbi:amidase [Mycolicibacterium sp. CBM1]
MTVALRPWTGEADDYLAGTARLLAELEPRVRAFSHVDLDGARADAGRADGPLAGMPIAVKEIIDVAGMPVTLGSTVFTGRIATRDAEAVARLRRAGAVVVGMTTTTPFACGTTTDTDNPHRPGHTPGGSSAGSAAAVGAGMLPVALASQSQASTLRPASYCGAWGFKPSHLRFPREGMHLLAGILDDLGLIAASVDDLTAVFGVLAEPPAAPLTPRRPLRVGRLRLDDGGLPRAATVAALDDLLGRLGAPEVTVEADTPALAEMDWLLAGSGHTCFDLFAGQSATRLAHYAAAGEPDPRLREMVTHAAELGADGVARALAHRDRLRDAWAGLADHYDVLVALATTNPAPVGHASTGCRRLPATSSLLGIPALTAPWLTVDGLPQGVQLLGFEGRDEDLLAAARVLTLTGVNA